MANNQNFRVEMFKQNNLRSPNEFKSGSDFLTYFNTLSYDHKFYILMCWKPEYMIDNSPRVVPYVLLQFLRFDDDHADDLFNKLNSMCDDFPSDLGLEALYSVVLNTMSYYYNPKDNDLMSNSKF